MPKVHDRVLNPNGGRLASSPYKVDVGKLAADDYLVINITHKERPFDRSYHFYAKSLTGKNSIHFNSLDTVVDTIVTFAGVQPDKDFDNNIQPIIIDLKPEWFKPGYYVYIVEVKKGKTKYYYVGMTGDRKHLVARSPFYRMGGHFTLSESSTQNQIIKGLKTIAKVEDVVSELQSWNFKYYAYLVEDFNKNVSKEEHDLKRVIAEHTEAALIDLLKEHEYTLFNKDVRLKTDDSAEKKAQEIFKNFQNQLK